MSADLAPGILDSWGMGPCVLLPGTFDHSAIAVELGELPDSSWNQAGRNPAVQGQTESFFGYGSRRGPGGRMQGEREILRRLPSLREVVYGLPAAGIERVIVARLNPGRMIALHSDHPKYYSHTVRIVIPVVTGPRVRIFCDGAWWHFRADQRWAFDNLRPHAVVNDGDVARTHVLVDLHPNERLRELVTSGESIEGHCDDARFRQLEIDSRKRYTQTRWHHLAYRVLETLTLR